MFFLASTDTVASLMTSRAWPLQPAVNGNDMDTYADDLAELVQKLDLQRAIHVGHSTGGGEVARYNRPPWHEASVKAVLIGAVPPLMLKLPRTRAACEGRF